MARIFNIILAFLTLAPLLAWLGAVLLRTILLGAFGCQIETGTAATCSVLGSDMSEAEAAIGEFAAAGFWIFWPLILCAGMMWAMLAGSRLIFSNGE